jgi:general secretion pathway protein D
MKNSVILLTLAALLVSGCATDRAYKEGQRLIQEGKAEEGLTALSKAMKADPDNLQYRATYYRTLDAQIARLEAEGDAALKAGRLDEATSRYRDVLRLHPDDARAPDGLARVEQVRRNEGLLHEAEDAIKQGYLEKAHYRLQTILAQSPDDEKALALLKIVDEKSGKPQAGQFPQLSKTFQKSVTVEFSEAPIRAVFDALSKQSGINFVFDKDVRADQKINAQARNTSISDVLDMVLVTSQLAKKLLNDSTVLVYPDTPAKQKQYQELAVRAFFLTNIDAKGALTMVKTLTKSRDVYVDDKLNILFVRDTPEAIGMVEKLLDVADQPEPEVMLDVEILEVSRTKMKDLGVQWPTQFSLLSKLQVNNQTIDSSGGTIATNTQFIDVPQTLDLLKHISGANIGISPTPTVNINANDGDANILANPRIRVRNQEKANIHIGDKVPVITSNVTSTGVTSESVSYLDVGLKLEVEPRVHLDGEVDIKVGLEVSNIAQQVKSANGTVTYQLGSRAANTVLQLKDGETQVLAGLISDEDRSSMSKLPGLGDIPLLGHLFSDNQSNKKKSEIILLITPHVLRNVQRPELARSEFFAGTEESTSNRPLMLRPSMELPVRPEPAPQPTQQPTQQPVNALSPSALPATPVTSTEQTESKPEPVTTP